MTDQVVFMLQLVITGVAVGGVYSLMALGFVLIFKASSVVNFGPGELVLFGAYVVVGHHPDDDSCRCTWPCPLTFVIAILLGLVIERGVLRPLIGEPIISVIMVTFGVASVIRGFLNMTWGSDTRPFPVLFSPEPIHLGPVPVSPVHLWSFVGVLVLLAAFSVFFKFSPTGMAMRATADNQQVAQSLGVSVKRVFALSWCIATVVSTLGGIILGSVRRGRRFLARRPRAQGVPGGDPGRPGQHSGRDHRRRADRRAREPVGRVSRSRSWAAGSRRWRPSSPSSIILMLRPYGFFGKRRDRARLMQVRRLPDQLPGRRAHLRHVPADRRRRGVLLVALAFVPRFAGTYWLDVLNRIGIAIIGALGLNILVGYTGPDLDRPRRVPGRRGLLDRDPRGEARAAVLSRHPGSAPDHLRGSASSSASPPCACGASTSPSPPSPRTSSPPTGSSTGRA